MEPVPDDGNMGVRRVNCASSRDDGDGEHLRWLGGAFSAMQVFLLHLVERYSVYSTHILKLSIHA
jgi:hypothetical protein